jgi:hypothetical protein
MNRPKELSMNARHLTGRLAAKASANGHKRHARAARLLVASSAVALAAVAATPWAAAHPSDKTIEGVWRVTRHGVNCQTGQVLSSFPAIMAFGAEGSLSGYAIPPGSSPALASPEYGTWQREHGQSQYSFRLLGYNYGADGVFSGSTEVSASATLGEGGTALSYSAKIQFFDASGGLQFAVCGAATGTRF